MGPAHGAAATAGRPAMTTAAEHDSGLATVLYARLAAHSRLRQLQLLVEIDDCGSIARAAERLHLSQPAATQALAELERLLDIKLFERHARGARATAAGRALLAAARGTLAELREAAESLAAIRRGAPGTLRLGAIPAATASLMPPLLAALAQSHPEVHLELLEDRGSRLLPLLTAGGLDAVFCRRPPALPSGFRFEALRDDAVVVAAGATHPLAGRRGLALADLAESRWVLPAAHTQLREIFEQTVRQALPDVRCVPASTISLPLLAGLLAQDGVVTLVPLSLADALIGSQPVVRLGVSVEAQLGPLGVAYDAGCQFELLQECLQLARRGARPPQA